MEQFDGKDESSKLDTDEFVESLINDNKECNDGINKNEETKKSSNDIPRWHPCYEETEPEPDRKPANNRKLWMIITAMIAVLCIAGVSICFSLNNGQKTVSGAAESPVADSAAVNDTADKNASLLNLTDMSETANTVSSISSGYILTDVSAVVDEVLPSVVSVTSRSIVNYYGFPGGNGYNNIWNGFNGNSSGGSSIQDSDTDSTEQQNEVDSGIGSGTIIAQNSTELLILTSYHVVEDCSSLYVTFIDDNSVDGYIKSADEDSDIAIVAVPLSDIEQNTLDSIKIATICTDAANVGEGVIVIGNALGYGISVTTGIVSAVDRQITVEGKTLKVIQTDAAINAGNSGGCMLNSRGEIIGINEAKVTVDNVEGMCYAIPVASNLELIQELLNSEGTQEESSDNMETAPESMNESRMEDSIYLGIRGRDVTSEIADYYNMPQGVYVSSTIKGSGADEAGIVSGDVIVGIDDVLISTMEELQAEISKHKSGDVVVLIINRKTGDSYSSMTVNVTLTGRI